MRTVVVMHAIAGKSTLARAGVLFDCDSARTNNIEALLSRYRQALDWVNHDLLWTAVLTRWARTLPDNATIAVHHPAHAAAVGGASYRTCRYHPTIEEFARRLVLVSATDPGRSELAVMNRGGLMNNNSYLALPEWVPPRVAQKGH